MYSYPHRLRAAAQRFAYWLRSLPLRVKRLFGHLGYGWQQLRARNYAFHWWWLEATFYLFDVFAVPEIYETSIDLFKRSTRPLLPNEINLASSIFGNTIDLKRVRIDQRSYIGCKPYRFAYVSFFTINSWGNLPASIFIHELVHVWQYHQLGSVYIPRALRAQRTRAGYNYGGVSSLKKALENQQKLQHFNLEQQADIIADYFRLLHNYKPNWGTATQADIKFYLPFLEDLRKN